MGFQKKKKKGWGFRGSLILCTSLYADFPHPCPQRIYVPIIIRTGPFCLWGPARFGMALPAGLWPPLPLPLLLTRDCGALGGAGPASVLQSLSWKNLCLGRICPYPIVIQLPPHFSDPFTVKPYQRITGSHFLTFCSVPILVKALSPLLCCNGCLFIYVFLLSVYTLD